MLDVAAAITTKGVLDWVAMGAVAKARGVRPKPAKTLTFSFTTSSWASRLVTSGAAVSSFRISSTFLPATVLPFWAMYKRAAASICLPVEAKGPVMGRIRPILKVSCAWAALVKAAAAKAMALMNTLFCMSRLRQKVQPR